MDFHAVGQAEVGPLIGRPSFIADVSRWGLPFSRGLFEIPTSDFSAIEEAMRAG